MTTLPASPCSCLVFGCATLPEIHPWSATYSGTTSPSVVGARGLLREDATQALLARVQGKAFSADVFERHVAIGEAIAGPLTLGNSASLLQDGPATYKAMFSAIERRATTSTSSST